MIGVFAGLRKNVDNQLADRDCAMHALGLAVIWLGDDRMQALIVEINQHGVHAPDDAMNRAVVEVQEAQRALVADFAFDGCDSQHARKVQDVRVEMRTVNAVSNAAG